MAFRVIRQRKEARRNAKLNDIFEERDPDDDGKISLDQLADIYRIYEVDLDEEAVQSITDSAGFINREDFMKFAKDDKLIDFSDRKAEETPKKEWAPTKTNTNSSSGGLLCCCRGQGSISPVKELDRVELAFNRMDRNSDGYLTWEEFSKNVGDLDPAQAKRIFRTCDQDGDHRITLVEFKTMANSNSVQEIAQ